MKNFRSFKGMSSDERLASLEQVVSRTKRLMLLLPDDYLLLSNAEQEELWGTLRPYIIFDPERDKIPTLHHIYILDVAGAEVSLTPFKLGPDCYSIINGHGVAAQIIAGGRSTHIEVVGEDNTPRAVWSVQSGEVKDGRLVIGFDEIVLDLNSDFLAISDISVSTRTRSDLIKTLMMRYLNQTNGEGDLRNCIEFLVSDPEVQEGTEGEIMWTSYGGKLQTAKRKTIQNRLNECKKLWMSHNS